MQVSVRERDPMAATALVFSLGEYIQPGELVEQAARRGGPASMGSPLHVRDECVNWVCGTQKSFAFILLLLVDGQYPSLDDLHSDADELEFLHE